MTGTKIAFIIFCAVMVVAIVVALYRAYRGGLSIGKMLEVILDSIIKTPPSK